MQTLRNQKGFGAIEIIIVMAVVALLTVGGWYIWQAQNKNDTTDNPQNTTNSKNVYKIPEFGVEFDVEDGITPLHKTVDYTFRGKAYQAINVSTQQLVDKGATIFSGQQNRCAFVTPDGQFVTFAPLVVRLFTSTDELLAVEPESFGPVSASNIKTENGFFTIDGKLFHVPQQQEARGGNCLSGNDASFETQQRELLQKSMLSLRKSS